MTHEKFNELMSAGSHQMLHFLSVRQGTDPIEHDIPVTVVKDSMRDAVTHTHYRLTLKMERVDW